MLSFLPQGVEIELIFALRVAVSEILANFLNCNIWAWNFDIGKSYRRCMYTLFLLQKLSLLLVYGQRFPRYLAVFQNCPIWAWNVVLGKIPEVAHIVSLYPRGWKIKLIFALRAAIFEIEQFKLQYNTARMLCPISYWRTVVSTREKLWRKQLINMMKTGPCCVLLYACASYATNRIIKITCSKS